jgi:glycosyltransferase 2 family protein
LWLGAALATYLVGQSLCAYKWGLLAGALGFRRTPGFYWANYVGAMFPSLFLPTVIGGDVFRVVALARGQKDKVGATVSVLADRGTGVLAMVWIASVALLLYPSIRLPGPATDVILWLSAILTLLFFLPFVWRPAFLRRGLPGKALQCWDQPRMLMLAVGQAFIFQALLCLAHWLLGTALRVPVGPEFYLVLGPVVSVAAMSPMTIGGLGERVAALVLLFGLAGVDSEQGLAFGLAWTGMAALAALFGGAVLFFADRVAGWTEPGAPANGD